MVKPGDTIRIIYMEGEPQYTGKEGIVRSFDDAGQIWISNCGCAIIPEVDEFEVIAAVD